MPHETASQTAGPFLHIAMAPAAAGLPGRDNERPNVMAGADAQGERIRLVGTVQDGTGTAIRDCAVEIWQANAAGKYDHPEDRQDRPLDPAFRGFGRAVADFATGEWWFETVKPGRVPGRDGKPMAPHLNVTIFARGINLHLQTRIYFADETAANAEDQLLRLIEQPVRRETLMAHPEPGDAPRTYRITIRLQGEGETVFLDV